jgi:uncharacterized protein (DUF2267 family)
VSYDELLDTVQAKLGTEDRSEVERTTLTVIQALCDRITGKEAFDLLAQLPARVKKSVEITQAPMQLSREQFLEYVAEKLGVPRVEARERIRAVFYALRQAVSWGELEDILLELDPDYVDLIA